MTGSDKLIEELKSIIPCSCIEAYTSRKLSAPDCCWCNYGEDILEFILTERHCIIKPLVNLKWEEGKLMDTIDAVDRAIEETILRAKGGKDEYT